MSIQVLKPKYHVEECLEQIRECLEIGWTGMGFKTVEFENEWKKYTGHENAHFLNSATVGLHLAVEILKQENGWNDGDEIITTPVTFVSTNHAILYENMKAVFADIDEYFCIDPDDVEQKITDKIVGKRMSPLVCKARTNTILNALPNSKAISINKIILPICNNSLSVIPKIP